VGPGSGVISTDNGSIAAGTGAYLTLPLARRTLALHLVGLVGRDGVLTVYLVARLKPQQKAPFGALSCFSRTVCRGSGGSCA
jgi:hypothetical protein